MRETFTRAQHVALDRLNAIRTADANVALDRTTRIKEARAAGLTYAEIGAALGISRQAVHYHVTQRVTNT